jgi:hypothetical protein
MQELSWLENLQKCEPVTPLPEPAAKIDEFADLFKVDGDAVSKSTQPFDTGASDSADAVETLLKANQRERFRIREAALAEPQPERLFTTDPPSLEGFVEEKIGKILGVGDIAETQESDCRGSRKMRHL